MLKCVDMGILKLKDLKFIVFKISRAFTFITQDLQHTTAGQIIVMLCPSVKKDHVWFTVLSYLQLKCIIIVIISIYIITHSTKSYSFINASKQYIYLRAHFSFKLSIRKITSFCIVGINRISLKDHISVVLIKFTYRT